MPRESDANSETTIFVQRAVQGEEAGVTWIVEHFTPFLLAQARYRMARRLRETMEPEDLVQRVWAICLPKLPSLKARDGRLTPVLMRFLGTVLTQEASSLTRSAAARPAALPLDPPSGSGPAFVPTAPSESASLPLQRAERRQRLEAALARLSPEEQEILVRRGVEQSPYADIAAEVGLSETALRVRYHRALQSLRDALPASMALELEDV